MKSLNWDLSKSIISVVLAGIFLSTGISTYLKYTDDKQYLEDVAGEKAVLMSEHASLALSAKIQQHLDLLESIAYNPFILDNIRSISPSGNSPDADVFTEELRQIDQLWLIDSAEITQFQIKILQNSISRYLVDIRTVFPENLETIITDRNGLVVAMSNLTTDYYQADEGWWQAAVAKGTYFDTPVYDESTRTWVIITAIAIHDPISSEKVVGVIRGTLDVTSLLEMIFKFQGDENMQTAYVSSTFSIYSNPDGKLRISTVSPENKKLFTDKQQTWSKQDPGLDGSPAIMAIYPIYGQQSELGWVVTSFPEDVITQRLIAAIRQNILVAVLLMGILGLIAGAISRYLMEIVNILKTDISNLANGYYFSAFSKRILNSQDPNIASLLHSFVQMKDAIQSREVALTRSEEKYRVLIETMDEGLVLMDQEGIIRYVNRKIKKMMAFSSDEIFHQELVKFLPDIQAERDSVWRHLLHEMGEFETELLTQTGLRIPVSVSLQSIFLENSQQAGVMAVISDISLRKKNELAIQKKLKELAGLREIDRTILTRTTFNDLATVVIHQLISELSIPAGAIHIFAPNSTRVEYSDVFGIDSGSHPESIDIDQARRMTMIESGNTLLDISEFPECKLNTTLYAEPYRQAFLAPIVIREQLKGILELAFMDVSELDDTWSSYFASVLIQTAVGIDKIELLRNLQVQNEVLQESYDGLINGWARALELRDEETKGHSDRVTNLAIQLAQSFGFSGEDLQNFRVGCLLHDIGKMGVPDTILLKPGKLTEEEWIVMRKHPEMAFQLLSDLPFLKDALDIPFCHHELWNGTGYPHGLAGEEIPLAARIFTVVDVWDALSSDRPYRNAWGREKVIQYIVDNRGVLYDPQVVDRFMQIIQAEA